MNMYHKIITIILFTALLMGLASSAYYGNITMKNGANISLEGQYILDGYGDNITIGTNNLSLDGNYIKDGYAENLTLDSTSNISASSTLWTKVNKTGDTMSGPFSMGNQKITDLAVGSIGTDAARLSDAWHINMSYPGAGVGVSTGSAWGTSLSTTGTGNLLRTSTGWDKVNKSGDTMTGKLTVSGYDVESVKLIATQTTGTAPLTITSTTKVSNLNVDKLDDADLSTSPLTTSGADTNILSEQAIAETLQLAIMDGVYRQALLNGNFQINQWAVSTYTAATTPDNGDDHYLFDQWILLSDGNDIADVSQDTTTIPTGGASAAKFEVETANKKFGIVQIIENKDAIKYAGQTASVQFKARTTTSKVIENVRVAVLSWNSTADTVTSDVVASWGNEGSNPTWATNWVAENTAANQALVAGTWTTYKVEGISIDTASMTNLAVVIWVDDTDAAADDLLYVSQVQLNVGALCLPYMPRAFSDDLRQCQRFWSKSYLYTVPVQSNTVVGDVVAVCSARTTTSLDGYIVPFPVQMRAVPTITTYRRDGGASDPTFWRLDISSTYIELAIANISDLGFHVQATTSGLTANTAHTLDGHWTADARL